MQGEEENQTHEDEVALRALKKAGSLSPVSMAIAPEEPDGSITWRANEFMAHSKSPMWYVVLFSVAILIAALVWLLTKDLISTAVVILMAIVFGIFAAKKPRTLEYRVGKEGVTIGRRQLAFNSFRSFAVMRRGDFSSIVLLPLKRFALSANICYDSQDESKIVDVISQYLPMEDGRKDILDDLMWRLRF